MIEPTKQCAKCEQRKPWSDYYAKVKWPDGTMRQPHSRCKGCFAAAQNRKPKRAYDRRRYRRIRRSPRAWQQRLEDQRFQYRQRRGVVYHVSRSEPAPALPPEPFAAWLQTLGATDTTIGLACGLDPAAVRVYRRCKAQVSVDIVDRALLEAGDGTQLDDLYPTIDQALVA